VNAAGRHNQAIGCGSIRVAACLSARKIEAIVTKNSKRAATSRSEATLQSADRGKNRAATSYGPEESRRIKDRQDPRYALNVHNEK